MLPGNVRSARTTTAMLFTLGVLMALSRASWAQQRRPPLTGDVDCVKCHPPGGRKYTTQFTKEFHATHGNLDCRECHQVQPHGALRLNAQKDCSTCHHDPKYHARCPQCHPTAELPAELPMTESVQLSVWDEPRERIWEFQHSVHVPELQCAQCHHEAPAYAVHVDCADCHDQHHDPQTRCQACHGDEVLAEHERPSHLACATSGCHSFEGESPVSAHRSSCTVCHGEQEDHELGQSCVTCHVPSGHRFPIRTGR